MTEAPDQTIAVVTKNSRESIHVMLRQYKGHHFVDLRLFSENAEREVIATKTGITIKPDILAKVIEGLQQAYAAARAEGLL